MRFIDSISDLINFYSNDRFASHPVFRLIQTRDSVVLYDTGTNHILECETGVKDLLVLLSNYGMNGLINRLKSNKCTDENLLGATILKAAIIKYGILLYKPELVRVGSEKFDNFDTLAGNNLQMVTLETTEKCNLRCKYCIYSGKLPDNRVHGMRDMELDTAIKAVNILRDRSRNETKPAIAFYGGEPLMNFELIREIVAYSRNIFSPREIAFSITTNGTLINPEIADYLTLNSFVVLISIDGPEDIHNENRIFENGVGSFHLALNGLRVLIESFRHNHKEINGNLFLNTVFSPPFTSDQFEKIKSLWEIYPWLCDVKSEITYPVSGSVNLSNQTNSELTIDLFESILNDIQKCKSTQRYENFAIKPIHRIATRRVTTTPINRIYPNGCCVPGVRRMFIKANGEIHICDRILDSAPAIGTVNSGVDVELLKQKYIVDYFSHANNICLSCWANRLCGLCYTSCFTAQDIDPARKQLECNQTKYRCENQIAAYVELVRNSPQIVKDILSMVFE